MSTLFHSGHIFVWLHRLPTRWEPREFRFGDPLDIKLLPELKDRDRDWDVLVKEHQRKDGALATKNCREYLLITKIVVVDDEPLVLRVDMGSALYAADAGKETAQSGEVEDAPYEFFEQWAVPKNIMDILTKEAKSLKDRDVGQFAGFVDGYTVLRRPLTTEEGSGWIFWLKEWGMSACSYADDTKQEARRFLFDVFETIGEYYTDHGLPWPERSEPGYDD